MKIAGDENIAFLYETFSRLGEVNALPPNDITPGNIKEADILLVRSVTKVNRALLGGSNVKFVGTATTGIDHIDEEYLKSKGIALASAPGSNSNAVAEYVVACLLMLAKRKDFALQGKPIGVIGVGNVGSKVVKKCEALGMKLLLNDPPLARKTKNKKYLPLEALFDSDIVTLHTPLTYKGIDATYHMVNKEFFGKMKPGSILINTSRGGVVDELALLESISKLKAVVFDVWENEPNINLALLEKVELATPHIAGYSLDGKVNATSMLYRAIYGFLNKKDNRSPLSLLPPTEKEAIEVGAYCNTPLQTSEEEIIAAVVKGLYDLEEDDRKLRKILSFPAEGRGKYFEDLRENYNWRREFYNTTLSLANCPKGLRQKFKGLGFLCGH